MIYLAIGGAVAFLVIMAYLYHTNAVIHARLDTLGVRLGFVHQAALAPVLVSVVPQVPPVVVGATGPATGPSDGPSKPTVTDLLFGTRPATGGPVVVDTPPPPAPTGAPNDLWPLSSGLWPIGELQAGQGAHARYCVPVGWVGTITFAVSGFDTRGHTVTIDGKAFDTTPFASPDPRCAEGWHDIVVTAIGLGSGSANLWHDPR